MNDKKFCFILCVNNEMYQKECLYYLNRLFVPVGYETDIITIGDAPCMTGGYNAGMLSSDAKYKIYLHQDVFIINRNFLSDILAVFLDPSIGMIGLAGSKKMPKHGVIWHAPRVGCIYDCHVFETSLCTFEDESAQNAQCEVEAIDGLLMATQYDIPWREDIFTHWDFYDISQSFEFRNHGYKIAVPQMSTPWCIHDNGFLNLDHYFDERNLFVKTYGTPTD